MENDTNNENLNSSNETEIEESVETSDTTAQNTQEETVDVEQLKATNKKLYERAKTAEAELKTLRGQKQSQSQKVENKPSTASSSDVEKTVLRATGMPPELLKELEAVAQVRGIGLIEAQNDSLFVAIKGNFEKEKKQKEASLPASKGSTSSRPKVTFATPGLTKEQHKELWKASNQ